MRLGSRIIVCMIALCLVMVSPALAQDTPNEVNAALQDLGNRVGQSLSLNSLDDWQWQGRQFNDASLGCPAPGESYAQQITPGYQFQLQYQGTQYDYRVAEGGGAVILCNTIPVVGGPPASQPVNPQDCGGSYVIQPGDTLYRIAQRCDTSINALLQVNPYIDNRALIYAGRELTIPGIQDGPVSIAPSSGPPGTAVTVTAEGFPANTTVDIGIGLWASEYQVVANAQTDSRGNVSAQVTVPASAGVNQRWVAVVAIPNGERSGTSNIFYVTPPGDGNEDLARFTHANIFLVAQGDAGQSGIPVGCDDSLIPVTVNFAPTVAPLTAALEELFAINSQMYGQSGLYNPLYQSDLAIQGISIDASDTAHIDLSGDVSVGGVCDVPRVTSMIEQTALQYNTIDSVEVTLNGQPLSDALN